MTVAPAATHPVRDHPTRVEYIQLSCWAWFLYAFGATQALLRDEQGTTLTASSRHGSSMALGGLIGALRAARAIRMVGRGALLRISGIVAAMGMLVYTVPGAPPPVTMAAAVIASAGLSVLVLERNETIGGGCRTESLTLPGFLHDVCAAIHPMAVVSPIFQRLPLTNHGLTWASASAPLAHPFDDGSAATLHRDIEDMRAGVHEHLMFGEGEIDFPPVIAALHASGYRGGLHVELSRHSYDAPNAARRAAEFLQPLVSECRRYET